MNAALAARPGDEAPLHSLRIALEPVVAAEDTELLRRLTTVIAATPALLRSVSGGSAGCNDDPGALTRAACQAGETLTGMPLTAALPESTSTKPPGDNTLVLTPGCSLATAIRVPALS